MSAPNDKLRKNKLYISLLIILLTGSACSLLAPGRIFASSIKATPRPPTATSAPAVTNATLPTLPAITPATLSPLPTQTPILSTATPSQARNAKVLLDDNFSSQDTSIKNGWTFGTSDGFDQQWQQGVQVFTLKSANNIFWDYLDQTYQDVALTADMQATTPGYVEYGIIFGIVTSANKSEYLYSVDNQGEYYLQKMTNNEWAPVTPTNQSPIPITQTSLLNTGQGRNQLGVIYLGGTVYLYANGHFLNSYTDPNPIKGVGSAGLNFQTGKDAPVTVNLYRYTVYDPQSALNAWGTETQEAASGAALPSSSVKTLLDDNFSNQQTSSKNGWVFGTSADFDQLFKQGKQEFTLKSANGIFWDFLLQDYSDVAVSMDVQPTTQGPVEYGIIFRVNPASSKSEYLFSVNNQGDYYLQKMVNNQWAEVSPANKSPIPTTHSSYLNTGTDRNQIAVIALGDTIYLYANGHFLNSFKDPDPVKGAGKVGVNFQTAATVPQTVDLYRFTIYDAQSALNAWGTKP